MKAKNSHSKSKSIQADAIKLNTKHITECTEFCKVITKVALNNKRLEKNKNGIFNNIIMKEGFEPSTFGL